MGFISVNMKSLSTNMTALLKQLGVPYLQITAGDEVKGQLLMSAGTMRKPIPLGYQSKHTKLTDYQQRLNGNIPLEQTLKLHSGMVIQLSLVTAYVTVVVANGMVYQARQLAAKPVTLLDSMTCMGMLQNGLRIATTTHTKTLPQRIKFGYPTNVQAELFEAAHGLIYLESDIAQRVTALSQNLKPATGDLEW